MSDNIKFVIPEEQPTIIKVIGIGGAGCNAVNHMHSQGIVGVKFVVCNTDSQALNLSEVPNKVQLGPNLTGGRGAGAKPDIGKEATHESLDELKQVIGEDTQMLFITAGMGGGTGTGGAPVVAQKANEMGILTVGIITTPFDFEGPTRMRHAKEGIEEIRKYVDTLVIINNNRVNDLFGNSTFTEACAHADDVLVNAAKSIAEIITVTGVMNVDFADVCTVMRDSGVAIMGSAAAAGEDRAKRAVVNALSSPLLNDNNITGAKDILINIRYGDNEVRMEEVSEISKFVQKEAGDEPNIILGVGPDTALSDEILVTVLATGFEQDQDQDGSKALPFELGKVLQSPKDGVTNNRQVNATGPVEVPRDQVKPQTVAPQQNPEVVEVTLNGKQNGHQSGQNNIYNGAQNNGHETNGRQTNGHNGHQNNGHDNNGHHSSQNDRNERIVFEPEKSRETPPPPPYEEPRPINITYTNDREDIDQPDEEEEEMLRAELLRKSRKERLSQFSETNYEQADINEMEKKPAYIRKQGLRFIDVPDERSINVSRYTLQKDRDDEIRLKKGNSFIHDNID